MTWEELIEKVKDIPDIEIIKQSGLSGKVYQTLIEYNGLLFCQNGDITCDVYDIANCSPDQMYQIIKALTEKDKL